MNREKSVNRPWRVIIVGGGFGGLSAAKTLTSRLFDVTLIDRRNYHLYQPLLGQVAAGSLSPEHISATLQSVLKKQKNLRVLMGSVEDVDPDSKRVVLADGAVLTYDSLIAATGARSSYFGNESWEEQAPGLKSVEDATLIRRKLLYAFEMAGQALDPAERRAWLTFVVVGGGPSGVELAGAIAELTKPTQEDVFRSIRGEESQIILLDRAPRVLMSFPEDLAAKATQSLIKRGVTVRCSTAVKGIDKEGITIESCGSLHHIEARTVIWAGGMKASPFAGVLADRTNAETDKSGRLKVQPDLTVPNYPDIYVIGDLANSSDTRGKAVPGVTRAAVQGGQYAAKAILRKVRRQPKLPPFKYHDQGALAVIGRGSAVADVFGVHLSGWLAWILWACIHATFVVTFRNRLSIVIRWVLQALPFRRGASLMSRAGDMDRNSNNDLGSLQPAQEVEPETIAVSQTRS